MLITMAVHDTEENNRSWMTNVTLVSLSHTVDWDKHRLIVVDNGSCAETQDIYERWCIDNSMRLTLIRNDENVGTAKAVNQGWQHRSPGEHCVKMDNDVVIHQAGWVDWMEEVFIRDLTIGICGLKRKDLAESPFSFGDMKSTIRMLPHTKGDRWLIVEDVRCVIGTCQAYSSALLDKIGYLVQPGLYGFDDAISSVRARLAGFTSAFLHGFEIDHVDPGGDAYCQWKIDQANLGFSTFNTQIVLYESGMRDIYYDGGFSKESNG